MVKTTSYPTINRLDFAVYDEKHYVTMKDLTFRNVTVPKGFIFDGVSVPWFVTWLFTHNDLKRGIMAAAFHDFMCENKDKFSRREATSILMKLWKQAGLGSRWYTAFKPWLVYCFVEAYQMTQKGWK
ncbi:MAG: DUF1353 domain-containing protein [Alphaproteobacteria bacterium]|nr:DUF1353 domain-containing protein [Alphaproteobacteria bacterium]